MSDPGATAGGRVRLQVDERRQRLLELGLELFSAHSYHELSIDRIAKSAGISKGLLYHYFRSKRAYYVETVRYAAAQWLDLTQGAAEASRDDGTPDPEALVRGLHVFFEQVRKHARAYTTLLRGGLGADDELLMVVDRTRQEFLARIIARLTDEPTPLQRTAVRGWVGCVEAASLDWLEHQDIPVDELCEVLAASLLQILVCVGLVGSAADGP